MFCHDLLHKVLVVRNQRRVKKTVSTSSSCFQPSVLPPLLLFPYLLLPLSLPVSSPPTSSLILVRLSPLPPSSCLWGRGVKTSRNVEWIRIQFCVLRSWRIAFLKTSLVCLVLRVVHMPDMSAMRFLERLSRTCSTHPKRLALFVYMLPPPKKQGAPCLLERSAHEHVPMTMTMTHSLRWIQHVPDIWPCGHD